MNFIGWGTSLAWWANVNYPVDIQNELIRLIFSETGLGLNIVRYNLGGTDPTDTTLLKSVKAIPCIKSGPDESINLENDKLQISILDKAVKNGVNKVELFANSPPWWMTVSGKTQGADTFGTTNLKGDSIQEYSDFLIESYNIFKQKYPVSSLEPFNEPSNPFWTTENEQEGCFFDFSTRNKIIRNIKTKDPSIYLIACDSFSVGFEVIWNFFAEKSLIDRINIHGYGLSWRDYRLYLDDLDILRHFFRKSISKPLWISEYGMGGPDNITTAFALAKHIFRDLYTLKPEAWVYWQVVEDSFPNGWGLIQVPFGNPTEIKILKQYWVMMHFTKTLRQGDTYRFINRNVLQIKNDNDYKLAYIILGQKHVKQYINDQVFNIRVTNDRNNYELFKSIPNDLSDECVVSFFVENDISMINM